MTMPPRTSPTIDSKLTYLGIDPGKMWGWAAYDTNLGRVYGAEKFETLAQFERRIQTLVEALSVDAVITCRAMGRNQQVIRFHSSMAGVVECFCERAGISYFDLPDVTLRKIVVGKGNAKKPEVMAFLDISNEHAADAMVGALYLSKTTV